MIFDEIEKMREKVNIMQNRNDGNETGISMELVAPFLECLGFKKEWMQFAPTANLEEKVPDIIIRGQDKSGLIIVIKKTLHKKIEHEDLKEIENYLDLNNIEWGIYTNGKEYVLVNNDIKGEYYDREVIRYNIFEEHDKNRISYFTYNSLFDTKLSYYQKYLKQYEVLRKKEKPNEYSWVNYKDTVERYFNYLAREDKKFSGLKYLSIDHFIRFNRKNISENNNEKSTQKPIKSARTMVNRYAHMRNFYDLFMKEEILSDNPLKFVSTEKKLAEMYGLECKPEIEPLNNAEIECILKGYADCKQESERNQIIFLLCIYCGVMREELANLKMGDIDYRSRTIKFIDRSFIFPQAFMNRIENYVDEVKAKGYNSDYVFGRKYKGYTEVPLSISAINIVVHKASEYLKANENGRDIQINPEKIRGMLIKKLFNEGFSIEEIVSMTEISLATLASYITTEEILERTEIKSLDTRHPYVEIFNK